MTAVRPLFLLAVLLGGLFALKALSVADGALALLGEAAYAAAAPDEPADEPDDDYADEAADAEEDASPPPPPPNLQAPMRAAPTAAQLGLERRLAERRRELDARDDELDTREQLLVVAERRVDERIAELHGLRDEVRELLGQLDDHRQQQIDSIVAVYAQLEPPAAADILQSMRQTDLQTLLMVAEQLQQDNPRRFAGVMAEMQPAFAAELTSLLRARAEPPETAAEAEARLAAAEG